MGWESTARRLKRSCTGQVVVASRVCRRTWTLTEAHTVDAELKTTDEGEKTMMNSRKHKYIRRWGRGGDGRSRLEAQWLEGLQRTHHTCPENLKVLQQEGRLLERCLEGKERPCT
jgi:hypothetical protein